MKLKGPAPEEGEWLFQVDLKDGGGGIPEPLSPASKKNLKSINNTFKRPELPRKLWLDDVAGPRSVNRIEEDGLQQYMEKNTSELLPPEELDSCGDGGTGCCDKWKLYAAGFGRGVTVYSVYVWEDDFCLRIFGGGRNADCERLRELWTDDHE